MKKLLLLFLFSLGTIVNAQDCWTEYATSQPAASTGVASISIVDDNVSWLNMSCGTTGCTPIRRYAKSVDGGLTYTTGVIDLGASSASLRVANIHALDANTAWASVFPSGAGAVGGIWKTINGGTTWTRQNSASFNDPASFTNIVYFWDADNGVCMGDPTSTGTAYYEIYTTTNGGSNWTRTPISPALLPVDPQDYGLTNQFTVTGNTIWFGTTFGFVYKSTDKGLTWTKAQSPIPDFGGGINGSESGEMAFTSETNGLLGTSDYFLYSTTDAGVTWTDLAYDPIVNGSYKNFGIKPVTGLPNAYVSVGEDLDTSERGSSFSIDGGLNWVTCLDENAVDGGVVAFYSPTVGFASGFSTSAAVGGIFKFNQLPALANESFTTAKFHTLSPNPTSGLVTISGKGIANVVITDVLGKQVTNTNFTSVETATIDMTSYNAGIYLVKVTNADGNASTSKVVRQ